MRNRFILELVKQHSALLWGWVIVLIISYYIGYLTVNLDFWSASIPCVRALKIIADALIVVLPYWLLPCRMRWSSMIAVWGVMLICICDVVYSRFFFDTMPLSALAQVGNVENFMTESVMGVLTPADILVMFSAVLISFIWAIPSIRRLIKNSQISVGMKIAMCIISICVFMAAQYAHNKAFLRVYNWQGYDIGEKDAFNLRLIDRDDACRIFHKTSLAQSGFVCYIFFELYDFFSMSNPIHLTDVERKNIDRYALKKVEQDSITPKNVIFIIAESLNADVIGRHVDGVSVTPVLDSIIASVGTLGCLNVQPQVADGMSSDGQLMYNLGVMPLYGSAIRPSLLENKRLPSIASQLSGSHNTVVLFAEKGHTWKERDVFSFYGYKFIRTSDDTRRYANIESDGNDKATMQYAVTLVDSIPSPMFMQIITVSTHFPFTAKYIKDFCSFRGSGLSDREQDYIRSAHYLDESIGELIDGLRNLGVLDETILIIASDHHMNMNGSIRPTRPIAFIAANVGLTGFIESDMAQIDVFTTLCDILGLRGAWRGLGRSVLRTEAQTPVDYTRVRNVSDSILRSDYFK